jgi:uncharacterized protein (DUF2237 family)
MLQPLKASVATLSAMQVPFYVTDAELGDEWTCSKNRWDAAHASCAVPQILSDAEIDRLLQVLRVPFLPSFHLLCRPAACVRTL